jgi:hypothetical protein
MILISDFQECRLFIPVVSPARDNAVHPCSTQTTSNAPRVNCTYILPSRPERTGFRLQSSTKLYGGECPLPILKPTPPILTLRRVTAFNRRGWLPLHHDARASAATTRRKHTRRKAAPSNSHFVGLMSPTILRPAGWEQGLAENHAHFRTPYGPNLNPGNR